MRKNTRSGSGKQIQRENEEGKETSEIEVISKLSSRENAVNALRKLPQDTRTHKCKQQGEKTQAGHHAP